MKKKGFLTYDEQIAFLREEKNLEIQDEEYAKKILFKTGYHKVYFDGREEYQVFFIVSFLSYIW